MAATLAGKAIVPFEADTSGLLSTISSTVGSAAGMFGKMVPLAIVASIVAAGAAVVDLGQKYVSSTDLMAANAGITIKQANLIGSAFLSTGGQTEFTAQQMMTAFAPVAGQLAFLNGSALSAAQSVAFMNAAMALATATGQPLSATVKDLSTVLMAFKIPVTDAAAATDDLYNTSRILGVPMDSLTSSLTRARTAAGAAGPSLQDMSAFLADLAVHGESGRGAMTLLGTALTGLEAPSAAVKKAQDALGISFIDSHGNLLSLEGIIAEANPIIAGMGSAQAAATLKSIGFGGASSKLVETIQAGVPAFLRSQAAIDKTGTAAAGASEATDNLGGMWDKFKAKVIDLATSLGMTLMPDVTAVFGYITQTAIPAAVAIASGIGGFITKAGLLEPILAAVGVALAAWTIASVIAGAIAILTGAVAILAPLLAVFAPGLAASALAMMGLDTAIAANPIGLIVIAIAAFVAALVLVVTHLTLVKQIASDVWGFILSITTAVWSQIKGVVLPIVTVIVSVVTVAFNTIKSVITVVLAVLEPIIKLWWTVVSTLFSVYLTIVINVVKVAFAAIMVAWNVLSTAVKIVVQALWDTVSQIFQIAAAIVIGVVNGIATAITAIWNAIKGWVIPIVQAIGAGITLAFDVVRDTLATIWTVITSVIKTVWGAITTVFTAFSTTIGGIFNGIANTLSLVWGVIGRDATAAWNGIVSVIKSAVNLIIGIIDGIIGGINKVTGAIPFVGGKLQIPLIPKWSAMGALVTSPTLIGAGEAGPEVVMNKPQFQEMAAAMGGLPSGGGGGGATQTNTFILNGGDEAMLAKVQAIVNNNLTALAARAYARRGR
jgi:TP901 family phage tail tape measure protein